MTKLEAGPPESDRGFADGATRAGIVSGTTAHIVRARWASHLFARAAATTGPLRALRLLRHLDAYRKTVYELRSIPRFVHAHGRYFWSPIVPGFPSRAYDRYVDGEIARAIGRDDQWLHFAIMAITRRCSLHCAHCFESDTLAFEESLTSQDLLDILEHLQRLGIVLLQISGGEPLLRRDDALALARTAAEDADVWILTSGVGMTRDVAVTLRHAGCTGVNIGLDDWDETRHNDFRGSERAYAAALNAAQYAHEAGLIVALTLCAQRAFVTRDNLVRYLDLAREIHAGFVQVLEPRPVGRFHGVDVDLQQDQIRLLEDFVRSRNSAYRYRDDPILFYPASHQRRIGCFGSGNRYLYVDPTGEVHPCPFCRGRTGNILRVPLPELIARLRERGCPSYATRPHIAERLFTTHEG